MCSIAPRTHAKQPSSLAKQKALKVTRADAELAVPAPRCWKGRGKNVLPRGEPLPTFPGTSAAGAALFAAQQRTKCCWRNTRPPSGLGDRQDQRSSLLQPLLLAPRASLIPEAANPSPRRARCGAARPEHLSKARGRAGGGETKPCRRLRMVPRIPALTRGHTGSQPCPSSSLVWDQVPRRACTKRAAPNALLPRGTGTSPSPRSAQNPGATRACGERAKPPRQRHRPRRQMPLSPCSKMPAISRGLMKGARSSIPATSCRGKRLGCLRHQHPAPTICSASILKSAGARRSASPSLPTAEGGGGFLAKPRGSDGSASDLGSGSARGRGYFGASERRGASFPRGVSRARGKGGRAEVGDCSVIDRCLEPGSWGSSSSLLAELVPKS